MLDPLAALAAQAVAAAQNAIADAALNLGVPADILQAQISVGDLLTATVLAPKGGQDLLEILGQQVIAQLPPDVRPGESLVLQVTGFDANRILVRNLGIADPDNPPSALNIELPKQSVAGAITSILTSAAPKAALSQAAPAPTTVGALRSPSAAPRGQLAPPRAVFVAASGQPQARVDPLEARIAAARVSSSDSTVPADSGTLRSREASTLVSRRPDILARSQLRAPARVSANAAAAPRDHLRLLRVPQTPLTLAAVRSASTAVARFPEVLARLAAALPQLSNDPRVATLRTLAGFLARLDPRSEGAFTAQISSFVNNVLEGAEAKLSSLLRAHMTLDATSLPQTTAPPSSTVPQTGSVSTHLIALTAQAKAAERSVAIDHDLKSLVLSLVRTPPSQATPAFSQALSDTLATLTGAQLVTLLASVSDPTMLTLNLPILSGYGGQPAQIRISRDAPKAGLKLDADNFHVAFVLDTKTLGMVAIDLETVGRAVKVNVNAEHPAAADRFRNSLGDLQNRLEQLRYKVASIGAQVAVRGAAPIEPASQQDGHWDIQA
ncbi:MAG: flagellar hook-length control protein FliK [Candidatus Baltobacteraceae bacterium]